MQNRPSSQSEIARLLADIEAQHNAAAQGLSGYATVSRHDFIEAREHQIHELGEELREKVGDEQAISFIYNIYNKS